MGIFADFLAGAKSIDQTLEITALDRGVVREINNQIALGDADLPVGASFQGANEVQTLSASGASAGTFDIAVGFKTAIGEIFIAVTSIAYNATPATIESALDTAANGVIPNWTDGDVSVSGAGTAEANDTVFTYDGASVDNLQHPLSTVDGSSLTGGGSEAFAETTPGNSVRNVWGIFELYSLVDFGGTAPTQGGSLPTLTKITPESTLFSAAIGLEAALLDAFNLNPLPPASSQG
jgi:hypothetical protein